MASAKRGRRAAPSKANAPRPESIPGEVADPLALDRLVHERLRLGILSALAGLAANETLSFNDLKRLLGTTDGNLSVHARKLEDAGYVECRKSFVDRTPQTTYRLTAAGRRALQRYLDHMEAIIAAARGR